MKEHYDVVVVGGGPAGSTTATLLKKYRSDVSVAIFEREVFPRDHIGESQLPGINRVLDEMGCWNKVEAAGFPIKVGATFRWGKQPELWDFEFVPSEIFIEYYKDTTRPARFEGPRRHTAFQVDRSIYDKILLDHAAEYGVDVHQGTKISSIEKQGDKIIAVKLESGERITASYFVDASGGAGTLRRAMDVPVDYPSHLMNVAFWDYWQNADWAVEIGVGGTKIQVMSLGYGWIWFIPLGPTRTSIGLVIPAEYYKQSGKKPEELYLNALREEERISSLLGNARREGKFTTTKDWSYLAQRQYGENWFLSGESSGFADPILSAGMTIAHMSGREVAFTILELLKSTERENWLKEQYERRQAKRIGSHIRFADFWYTANAQFVDIQGLTQKIAADWGLDLSPKNAWEWLARGGFIDDDLMTGTGSFDLYCVKHLAHLLADIPPQHPRSEYNVFRLNMDGAVHRHRAIYRDGTVTAGESYFREDKVLPIDGAFKRIFEILKRTPYMEEILPTLEQQIASDPNVQQSKAAFLDCMQALEAMISDGWVIPSLDNRRRRANFSATNSAIRPHKDTPGHRPTE